MLDWLIVGGGVHGTAICTYLLKRGGVARDRIGVIDPHDEPLARWHAFTRNTGMPFLRSPVAHHLDVQPAALHHFAETEAPEARFTRPYHRPSVELFRRHCEAVIERNELRALRSRATALQVRAREGGLAVETDAGVLTARRVLLAPGAGDQPYWPGWARALRGEFGGVIHHVFDPGWELGTFAPAGRTVVVGGGITAAQVAVSLARRHSGPIALLMRHAPRVHQFDSDVCWLGEQCMRHFRRTDDMRHRRDILRRVRHRGSMPPDVYRQLRKALTRRSVCIIEAEVERATADPLGRGILLHCAGQPPIAADHVLLATGFDPGRPGGALVDRAVVELGLPVAPCGYPVVDGRLEWGRGIHVTGPLAELEIGPVARNIIGARYAALRLVKAA